MNTDDIDVKVGDVVIWAYIPKKTTKNIEDSLEYVRLINIKLYGKGPFAVLSIAPHKDMGIKLTLVKIIDKKGKETHINKLAFKKIKYKK